MIVHVTCKPARRSLHQGGVLRNKSKKICELRVKVVQLMFLFFLMKLHHREVPINKRLIAETDILQQN